MACPASLLFIWRGGPSSHSAIPLPKCAPGGTCFSYVVPKGLFGVLFARTPLVRLLDSQLHPTISKTLHGDPGHRVEALQIINLITSCFSRPGFAPLYRRLFVSTDQEAGRENASSVVIVPPTSPHGHTQHQELPISEKCPRFLTRQRHKAHAIHIGNSPSDLTTFLSHHHLATWSKSCSTTVLCPCETHIAQTSTYLPTLRRK